MVEMKDDRMWSTQERMGKLKYGNKKWVARLYRGDQAAGMESLRLAISSPTKVLEESEVNRKPVRNMSSSDKVIVKSHAPYMRKTRSLFELSPIIGMTKVWNVFMEKVEFCALGGGMFTLVGTFGIGEWATSLELRKEQLLECMRGRLSMNVRVSKDVLTNEEVDLGFYSDGTVLGRHLRIGPDAAGEMEISFADLNRLAEKKSIVIGYKEGGMNRKTVISNKAMLTIRNAVILKVENWSMEFHGWGTGANTAVAAGWDDRVLLCSQDNPLSCSTIMVCGIRAEHLEIPLGRVQTEAKIIRAVVGNEKVRHKIDLARLRCDLEKGLNGFVRAGNLGMEGSVQERLAIAVHLLEPIEVGVGSSTGIPIYDRIRVSASNDINQEYYGRQYLGVTEGELFAAACGNSLELVVMGVRGAWRLNEVNDFLRRSIRDMVQYRGEMEAMNGGVLLRRR